MNVMNILNKIALFLVIIGALNWGAVGLFSFDIVAWLFGTGSIISRIVYTLVGIGGLWCIGLLFGQTGCACSADEHRA